MSVVRRSLAVGTIYALLLVGVYSLVVIISSPILPPATALQLSLQVNWPFFLLLPSTFGAMMGLRRWIQSQPACPATKGEALGASTSILSAFFSLFSLTSVGCCALLASWVSILLGTGAVISLVEFSLPLTLSAFGGMMIAIVMIVRMGLRRRNIVASA